MIAAGNLALAICCLTGRRGRTPCLDSETGAVGLRTKEFRRGDPVIGGSSSKPSLVRLGKCSSVTSLVLTRSVAPFVPRSPFTGAFSGRVPGKGMSFTMS
jgi:hypothetical protein